jgi:hypothetical protein
MEMLRLTQSSAGTERSVVIDCSDLLSDFLTVGTRDTDDYYPWFEAVFHPDNMACNIGK